MLGPHYSLPSDDAKNDYQCQLFTFNFDRGIVNARFVNLNLVEDILILLSATF